MAPPDGPIIVCTDGSEAAVHAARAGLDLLGPRGDIRVVAAADEVDPLLMTGTGMASGLPPEEYDRLVRDSRALAAGHARDTAAALGLDPSTAEVVTGPAGAAVCTLAEEVGATAIVIGSRGRSGVKRALLGSVSDHVVRHAPCTVVITGPAA